MKKINEAQDYLTVDQKKIVDLGSFLRLHTKEETLSFMELFYKEKQGELQALVSKDKTAREIDDAVSTLFRLHMAISLMKEAA
jgi:hypothetical protein